jgi:outer membrane lipoprotein-sorting protein
MLFDEVRSVDGRLIPTRMTVIDEQEEGERTVLVYADVDWDVSLDESTFSLSNLERRR